MRNNSTFKTIGRFFNGGREGHFLTSCKQFVDTPPIASPIPASRSLISLGLSPQNRRFDMPDPRANVPLQYFAYTNKWVSCDQCRKEAIGKTLAMLLFKYYTGSDSSSRVLAAPFGKRRSRGLD
jgi:hypothetical protein